MQTLSIFLIAALIFGVCYGIDKAFTKIFRSKAQHRSGLAVRANRQYGIFGVILTVLGILALVYGTKGDLVLLIGGGIVLLMGLGLAVFYLSFGIFYDGESFLVSRLGKPSREYQYKDIVSQQLYAIIGGNTVIELSLKDGNTVSLQASMQGVYQFLDTAVAGWCIQNHKDIADCAFYDPSKSWWFPHEEA